MDTGKKHRRVPFDGATSDYPARFTRASLWARSHFLCGRQTGCSATMDNAVRNSVIYYRAR